MVRTTVAVAAIATVATGAVASPLNLNLGVGLAGSVNQLGGALGLNLNLQVPKLPGDAFGGFINCITKLIPPGFTKGFGCGNTDHFPKPDYPGPPIAGYNVEGSYNGSIYITQKDVDRNGGVDPLVIVPGGYSLQDPNTPYDPKVCTDLCNKLSAEATYYNGVKKYCNEVNVFTITNNSVPYQWQCSFYDEYFGKEYAINTGQYDGAGNYYKIDTSYIYYRPGNPKHYDRQ